MNNQPAAPQLWQILAAAAVQVQPAEEAESFAAFKAEVPGRSARRMSRLGLMLNHLLLQMPTCEDTSLIYASTFAESRTLETYLESFPTPSPLGFQSSIHPGGVEQGLILRQQSVREFLPLAGCDLMASTLFYNLRLSSAPRTLLLAGEESATWLTPMRLAASSNFALALLLEPVSTETSADSNSDTAAAAQPQLPLGQLRACAPASSTATEPDASDAASTNSADSLITLAEAIRLKRSYACTGSDNTRWTLDW